MLDQKSYIGPWQRNLGVNVNKVHFCQSIPPPSIIWNWSRGNGMGEREINNKHCQRTDGPRGWVLSSKYLRQVITQVDQNLNYTWASKSQPNICLKVLTKLQLQNILPVFNLKVFNENILQNHDQILVSKPWQYIALKALTKIKVQILYQTSASKSWLKCRQHVPQHQHICNNNNLKKFWVGIFKNQSHISQVSQWVDHKGSQWSDLGLIKISFTAILIPDYILMTKTMASSTLTL